MSIIFQTLIEDPFFLVNITIEKEREKKCAGEIDLSGSCCKRETKMFAVFFSTQRRTKGDIMKQLERKIMTKRFLSVKPKQVDPMENQYFLEFA